MCKKFLKGIIDRCEEKLSYDNIIARLWGFSMELYFEEVDDE